MIVTDHAVRRDQWGRYKVVPPTGGKPVGYTRATTIAKALDDTSNLMAWGCRMTAIGLAQRPDLLAMVATSTDDKRKLDDLCERAKEAGGATVRRDLGTALHSMIEQSYTTPGYVAPGPYAADVAAVHAAVHAAGLEVVEGMHERIVVHDRHRIAGTFDLVVTDGTEFYIADIKTGSSIVYGALGFAVQLGIYATADNLYVQGVAADGADDRRDPMPAVSRTEAVIIHVEPESAVCTLHRLDIVTGVEALETAMAVRGWRQRRGLLIPLAPTPPTNNVTVTNPAPVDRRAWLADRVRALVADGHAAEMVQAWPAGVPTFKSDHAHTVDELDLICAAIDQVDAKLRRPFPDTTDPAHPEPVPVQLFAPAPVVDTATPTVVDDGGPVDDDEISVAAAALARRTAAQKATITRWAREADDNGYPINVRGSRTRRVWHIAVALIACASADPDDELMHALLSTVGAPNVPTVGERASQLSITQASRLHTLADAIGTPALTVTVTTDGLVLSGPATTN